MGIKYPANPKTIGEHLRKKRLEEKLLQKDVAKMLGVTEDTVTNWENNRSIPMKKLRLEIINFIGYDLVLPEKQNFKL
ncbi:MAG: helix-turn-helix transcriptional regulator [Bacteroidota bacterium]